jgi:hypothetical protein
VGTFERFSSTGPISTTLPNKFAKICRQNVLPPIAGTAAELFVTDRHMSTCDELIVQDPSKVHYPLSVLCAISPDVVTDVCIPEGTPVGSLTKPARTSQPLSLAAKGPNT